MKTTSLSGSRGMTLAADIAGDPAAPPIIFLHGGGQTRHAWSRALREFAAAGHHAIAYDARGHGDSAWDPDGDYSTNALVADLHAVISTLEQPPALVGASMGGITSLIAVGESKDSLARALVMVDVAPRIEHAGVEHIRRFMTGNPDGFASLEEAADAVAAYNPSRPRPRDVSGLMRNLREGKDGRLRWHWDPRFISTTQEEHVVYLQAYEERMAAAARRVSIPTLLVRGSESDVVSPEGARQFRELVPHAQLVDIGGAGHMVAGDRNDAFNETVRDFLSALAAEG